MRVFQAALKGQLKNNLCTPAGIINFSQLGLSIRWKATDRLDLQHNLRLICFGTQVLETKGLSGRNATQPERNGLFEKAGRALPVGRVGEPEDLAETYLYLMRERFSTGAMIVGDGGSTLV